MDSDIEELESLFSEDFGRTPTSTPFGSQASNDPKYEDFDFEDNDNYFDIDERARLFLQSQGTSEDIDGMINVEGDGNHSLDFEDNGDDDDDDDGGDNDDLPNNDTDADRIRKWNNDGCGCRYRCNVNFNGGEIFRHILNVREMDKQEKEMYIMATLVDDVDKENTKRGKKRQRVRHKFTYHGKIVCKKTFMLTFDIGKHTLQNILKHINKFGAMSRIHGNTGKKPANALCFDDIQRVVQFISNYADKFGLPQPAAPRGRDTMPPIYLPCSTTKLNMLESYKEICLELGARSVMYSTFCKIWSQCIPHVKIASPRDDVCATCEKLRKAIIDSITEEEKLESTNKMKDHITYAQKERDLYNRCVERAKDPEDTYVHYTFDFCQHVSVPHHARQMGPLYFKTPRKIQIFGFRVDSIPKQLNFLIDENETIGKDGTCTNGPNAVISMLHWALQNHGTGESSFAIHADNCPGQNKNQYVLGYFMWRVMTGRNTTIEYLMQVPGHARCHVDSGFASLKKLYRRSDCDSLRQLEEIVENSATTNCAISYPSWQWRDWKSFLHSSFRPLKGIRQYQYFRFSADEVGIVTVKRNCDALEEKINIRKGNETLAPEVLPNILIAGGLSQERQTYLFTHVRPYVRPAYKDITCPTVTDD